MLSRDKKGNEKKILGRLKIFCMWIELYGYLIYRGFLHLFFLFTSTKQTYLSHPSSMHASSLTVDTSCFIPLPSPFSAPKQNIRLVFICSGFTSSIIDLSKTEDRVLNPWRDTKRDDDDDQDPDEGFFFDCFVRVGRKGRFVLAGNRDGWRQGERRQVLGK